MGVNLSVKRTLEGRRLSLMVAPSTLQAIAPCRGIGRRRGGRPRWRGGAWGHIDKHRLAAARGRARLEG